MLEEVFDVIVVNGRLVLDDAVVLGGVAIQEGVIVKIFFDEPPSGRQVIDAKGDYVLPGLIDSHVHFRTPGLTHKETWATASRAAAAGGVTTVIDMPNTNPPLCHTDDIPQKSAIISGESLVDFGFHIQVMPDQVNLLESVDIASFASAKVFMTGHHTAPHVVSRQATLERIFEIAARRGILLTLHAEDDFIYRLCKNAYPHPTNIVEYERYLPRSGGIVAVSRIIELVSRFGTMSHVLHVSSLEEVQLLEVARLNGLPITFETTPHHLMLTIDQHALGTKAKISPAIRTSADKHCLWHAALSGVMTSIGSDHAPHSALEKHRPFHNAPPGLPGVQEMLPLVLTGLIEMHPDMTMDERMLTIARLLASGPAKRFKLHHRKGSLASNFDADLVIVNPASQWQVTSSSIQTLCGWSTYEGQTLYGAPRLTMRRGHVIYCNGEFGQPEGTYVYPIQALVSEKHGGDAR